MTPGKNGPIHSPSRPRTSVWGPTSRAPGSSMLCTAPLAVSTRMMRLVLTSATQSDPGSYSVIASRMAFGSGTAYSRITVFAVTASGAPYS